MESILQHINHFVEAQTVASVCCRYDQGALHCFSCYYAYDAEHQLLHFKTSEDTLHMQLLAKHPQLAGTILPDKLNKLKVQGIQFTGVLVDPSDNDARQAGKHYHLKHPLAVAMDGKVRTIRINWIKMTDNTLGFGTKLVWDRSHYTVPLR
jgi:uncharacterized protein YhbP (UPF0306 family)